MNTAAQKKALECLHEAKVAMGRAQLEMERMNAAPAIGYPCICANNIATMIMNLSNEIQYGYIAHHKEG